MEAQSVIRSVSVAPCGEDSARNVPCSDTESNHETKYHRNNCENSCSVRWSYLRDDLAQKLTRQEDRAKADVKDEFVEAYDHSREDSVYKNRRPDAINDRSLSQQREISDPRKRVLTSGGSPFQTIRRPR
jgi:hypothetical protein